MTRPAPGDDADRIGMLRPADSERANRVTFVELFFDLVFVFALTQISAYLSANSTPVGALEGVILILALWWAWVHTTWVTNWLDPERLPVRLAVFLLALVAFVMSVAIAESFGERAWAFAIAYVVLQIGRTVFMVLATRPHDRDLSRIFVRVLIWLAAGAVLWIGGALLPLAWQLPLWIAAIALEYVAGAVGFAVPGLGRAPIESWDISGTHIAERAALFVLIALGESLLATGFSAVSTESSAASVVAVLLAVVSAAAMWWIYFDEGERVGSEAIAGSRQPGRLARTAYTYVHLAVVGGIVVVSVGDKEMLTHPFEQSLSAALTILGGPLLFLIGTLLFRRAIGGRWMRGQLMGIAALAVGGGALGIVLPPLLLGVYATLVLVTVAAGGTVARVRRAA